MKSAKGLQAKRLAEHARAIGREARSIMGEMRAILANNPLSDDDKARLSELDRALHEVGRRAEEVPVR